MSGPTGFGFVGLKCWHIVKEMVAPFAGLAMNNIESGRKRKAGFAMVRGSKKKKKFPLAD